MNRKLHHAMTAAMTCTVVLAAVLLASTPLESEPLPIAVDSMTTTATAATATSPRHGRHPAATRSHQSVRMPFFSFFIPKG